MADVISILVLVCGTCLLLLMHCVGGVTAALLKGPDVNWPVLCPPQTFFNMKQNECLACSPCPMNRIITSPCHGLHDTQCGPFYDVEEFFLREDIAPNSHHKSGEAHVVVHTTPMRIPDSSTAVEVENGDSRNAPIQPDIQHWQMLTWVICIAIIILSAVFIVGMIFMFRRKMLMVRKLDCNYSPAPAPTEV